MEYVYRIQVEIGESVCTPCAILDDVAPIDSFRPQP